MFCYKCGRQMKDDEQFCPVCGTIRASVMVGGEAAVPSAPVYRPVAPAYGADALEGLARKLGSLTERLAGNGRYILVALLQLVALFFLNTRLGTMSLEYAGEDLVGRWIMDMLDASVSLRLFQNAGAFRVLFFLAGLAAAVLILRQILRGGRPEQKLLGLAAGVSVAQVFWFVLILVIARVKLYNAAAAELDRLLDGWRTVYDVTEIVRVELEMDGQAWACLAVFLLSAVVAVRALLVCAREQEALEHREDTQQHDDFFRGTDTSYVEKLRRESGYARAKDGVRRVTCPACGHIQPEGAGLCANCYNPVVILKSRTTR